MGRVPIGTEFFLFLICNKEDYVMAKTSYMTEEGLANLKKELDHLILVERPAISVQIAEARDKGDLSENAEYEAAKEAQGLLEMKIAKLEDILANARIIDESKIDTSQVQILNKVKIKNTKNNQQVEYTLVSERESDIKNGKISVSTPIARGLLGKKVGDVVDIQVPSGLMSFEILEISL
jgi:transcription elongation factor GreA